MWSSCWWFLPDSRIFKGSFLCVCLHTVTHYSFFLILNLQVKPRFVMSSDFLYVWHQSCVLLVIPKCSSAQFQVCISLTDQGWAVYNCFSLGPDCAHFVPSCVCLSQCSTLRLFFLSLLISRSVFLYTSISCETHKYLTIQEITACYCYVHKNYIMILQFYNAKINESKTNEA